MSQIHTKRLVAESDDRALSNNMNEISPLVFFLHYQWPTDFYLSLIKFFLLHRSVTFLRVSVRASRTVGKCGLGVFSFPKCEYMRDDPD